MAQFEQQCDDAGDRRITGLLYGDAVVMVMPSMGLRLYVIHVLMQSGDGLGLDCCMCATTIDMLQSICTEEIK